MNNSISDKVDEKGSTDVDNEEFEQTVNDQLPTPPRSNSALEEHSGAEVADSQQSTSSRSSHRRGGQKAKKSDELEILQEQSQSQDEQPDSSCRRHRRGGRKTRTKSQNFQSASEIQLPRGQPQEQDEQSNSSPDPEVDEVSSGDCRAEDLHKARSSRNPTLSKNESTPSVQNTNTGVKAFNIRRADSSGGSAPLSVTVERPGSESKSKKDKKDKKKRENSDEESEKEKKEGRKPISIRLDLNLELEIVFTAKIKGDVTITFLE